MVLQTPDVTLSNSNNVEARHQRITSRPRLWRRTRRTRRPPSVPTRQRQRPRSRTPTFARQPQVGSFETPTNTDVSTSATAHTRPRRSSQRYARFRPKRRRKPSTDAAVRRSIPRSFTYGHRHKSSLSQRSGRSRISSTETRLHGEPAAASAAATSTSPSSASSSSASASAKSTSYQAPRPGKEKHSSKSENGPSAASPDASAFDFAEARP